MIKKIKRSKNGTMKRTMAIRFAALLSALLLCTFLWVVPGCKFKKGDSLECRPEFGLPAKIPGVFYLEFLAVGDTGTGGDGQEIVADSMRDFMLQNPAQFVLLLGDNFYDDGVESISDPEFQTTFEEMYDPVVLNIPFYVVMGNHDHWGNVQAQLQYSDISERWTIPGLYYNFSLESEIQGEILVEFFAIDTTPINDQGNTTVQMEWLEQALSASTARWKVVFGHHTIYSNGKHGNNAAMQELVEPLLQIYGVDAYICGHDHDLQVLEPVGGVHYLVSGAGSSPRQTRCKDNTLYASSLLGFMAFRVSFDEMVVFVVRDKGITDFTHVISK